MRLAWLLIAESPLFSSHHVYPCGFRCGEESLHGFPAGSGVFPRSVATPGHRLPMSLATYYSSIPRRYRSAFAIVMQVELANSVPACYAERHSPCLQSWIIRFGGALPCQESKSGVEGRQQPEVAQT